MNKFEFVLQEENESSLNMKSSVVMSLNSTHVRNKIK